MWCLLGFTILCNNVDFWLFRSAYMFFFLLHTFWSDLKAQMGWVLYCKHIYIVIGSVCTCHYNKNIQYNIHHSKLERVIRKRARTQPSVTGSLPF